MADVFISYSHKDRDIAEKISAYLSEKGFTIWWDNNLRAGENFPPAIETAVNNAKCIVVIWSQDSIVSDWVRVEAAEGLRRKILIPLIVGRILPPLEFRNLQWIDISEWLIDYRHNSGKILLRTVSTLVSKDPISATISSVNDPLSELRRRLILSKSRDELRSGIYDLERYLYNHPHDTEARMLKDNFAQALANTKPPEVQLSPRYLRLGCIGALLGVFLGIVLSAYKDGHTILESIGIAVVVFILLPLASWLIWWIFEKISNLTDFVKTKLRKRK